MPKLYFRYGAMNSSKTANLIMVAHNYRSQGKSVLVIKPEIDTRSNNISSRSGLSIEADIIVNDNYNILENYNIKYDCILVDECQFLTSSQIDDLRNISIETPVIRYGLRTDFLTNLFPGSKRLMELADSIEEIKTCCVNCRKKAIINAKFTYNGGDKVILKEGENIIDIGADEKYQPMCWECYNKK